MKTIFFKIVQNLWEIIHYGIDYNNAAGATLLKSLSAVDILLPLLQEFGKIFLNEHLRKSSVATIVPASML